MFTNDILLGVNIDHVAQVRQARCTRYPDPLHAAFEAERAGADAITAHLREDRRHIQDRDIRLLRETLMVRLNLEMAVTEEMLGFAVSVRPDDCCLVPERRAELTTEGGLDVAGQEARIAQACARLADAGIRVSLFIDADIAQIEAAVRCKTPVIELHTGHYAEVADRAARKLEWDRLAGAARIARVEGIQVNAGHGLHYHNVADVAAIPEIRELNIGHAIVARALFDGFAPAVREMKRLMRAARHGADGTT